MCLLILLNVNPWQLGLFPVFASWQPSLQSPGILNCHNQSQPLPSHIELGRFKVFSAGFLHTLAEIPKQPETAQVAVKWEGIEALQ